jgi:hypothetical protein
MITETDKIEAEIIVAIQDSFCICTEDFQFSEKTILDYLEKCFTAKKTLDEQNKLNYNQA